MRTITNTTNTTKTDMTKIANKIIQPELSYKIVGVAYRVQNKLGRFCKEKQYANAFEEELKNVGLKHERDRYLPIELTGKHVGKNWADFVIENEIIVDLKAKPFIEIEDYYQMQRYLVLKKKQLGLIINFRNKYLKPKRVINSRYSRDS